MDFSGFPSCPLPCVEGADEGADDQEADTSLYHVSVRSDGDHDGKILDIKWMTRGQCWTTAACDGSLDNPKPSRTPGSCVSQHEPCKLSAGRESLPCCHSTLRTVEKHTPQWPKNAVGFPEVQISFSKSL